MTAAVLDASALLAVYFDEPGADVTEAVGDRSAMSAINWAEAAQRIHERGGDVAAFRSTVIESGLLIEPLSLADADHAAELRGATRVAGLSLADRCCLALAARLECPAYTADAAWERVADGLPVAVRLIR